MRNVRTIMIREHGNPAEVARCELAEIPDPGEGEVRVRMSFAPINPADINVLEGKYPIRPELPGVAGIEGAGVVEATGAGVTQLMPGDRVLFPQQYGTWREAGNVEAAKLVRIPDGVPMEQAAMLRINPATALIMLRKFGGLKPGEWFVQNAANSGVGGCAIRIARHYGWRSANVVRRPELIEVLKGEGGDVVVLDGPESAEAIRRDTGGAAIRLALNSVGGDSAVRLAGVLASGGVIVTFGAMGRQPLKIPNGLLIFNDIVWRGFWVSQWYRSATEDDWKRLHEELFELAELGVIATPVERTYRLGEIGEALSHAQRSGRSGKILLSGVGPETHENEAH